MPRLVGATFFPFAMYKFFRLLVGVVFAVSGLFKAADAAAFANLMGQYGAQWFGFASPLLIAAEVLLAVLLIFNIRPRVVSACATAFIVSVSVVYLYGLLSRGITDCGCFGTLAWLNTKPWLTFTRNALLVAFLVPSLLSSQHGTPLTAPLLAFMSAIGVIAMFMCGFSFRGAECLQKRSAFQPKPLSESRLSDFVTCDADSTYLVFAFSYGCPYCQNSIGNVNQYLSMGAVDRVIGLAVEDAAARERFQRLFDVNFEIREIPQLAMMQLTTTLPTAYYIRRDSIVMQYSGMVFSPALMPKHTLPIANP